MHAISMSRLFAGAATLAALTMVGCGGPPLITACDAAGGTTPVCGFQNPEDLAVAPGGEWLVVSEAPRHDARGRLMGFRPSDGAKVELWSGASRPAQPSAAGCEGAPDLEGFVPHGIDVTGDGGALLVVNHGGREAVERFAFERREGAPTLVWTDCVPMPDGAMMNDVAALADSSGFVVTEMTSTGLGMLRLLFGGVSGEVHAWSPGGGVQSIPGTEGAGPNGVEVSNDGETIYFAEWVAERLVRVSRDGSQRSEIALGFNPDNLTWTPDGRLLVAGQMATPLQATSCFDLEEGNCGLDSAAAIYDPASGELERVWTHQPASVTGGISVALQHGDRIWLGTFGGDRLAWIPAP